MDSLWPKLEKVDLNTPKAILAQQVDYFNSLETGLRAHLTSEQVARADWPMDGVDFVHTIRIVANGMGGFTLTLLKVSHDPLKFYPAVVTDQMKSKSYQAKDESELMGYLKMIFQSKETVDALQILISQNA